jgi:hypothetical protein
MRHPLLERLRRETSSLHQAVENGLDLLRPEMTLDEYRTVLEGFYGFYAPWEAKAAGEIDRLLPPLPRNAGRRLFWKTTCTFCTAISEPFRVVRLFRTRIRKQGSWARFTSSKAQRWAGGSLASTFPNSSRFHRPVVVRSFRAMAVRSASAGELSATGSLSIRRPKWMGP